jgi:hypothetical protein
MKKDRLNTPVHNSSLLEQIYGKDPDGENGVYNKTPFQTNAGRPI